MHHDFLGLPLRCSLAALCSAIAFALCVMQPSAAQDAEGVSIEVGDCIELESPEERLACFESRVDSALDEPAADVEAAAKAEVRPDTRADDEPASPPGPARPERAAAADRTSIDRFGFPEQSDEAEEEFEYKEMLGTVASVREIEPNRRIITLENGQVWSQMHPDRYWLRPGDQVRIYSTRWGDAYRLTVEELRGFIQVERVR